MASAAAYADCVASLRSSLQSLESSVQTLHDGVADFPRLVTVLKTVRHYELIPQPTLAAAEASLRDEIGPYIALLLSRADSQVERQERRIETLKARSALLQGRLARSSDEPGHASATAATSSTAFARTTAATRSAASTTTAIPRSAASTAAATRTAASTTTAPRAFTKPLKGEDRLRARIVRQRKEALRYGIERLELEVLQKERELRKRLEGSG